MLNCTDIRFSYFVNKECDTAYGMADEFVRPKLLENSQQQKHKISIKNVLETPKRLAQTISNGLIPLYS